MSVDSSTRGQLLIAEPALLDPNFTRTVVLVVEHGEEGALGLVLNRPTDTPVVQAAPELGDLGEPGAVIHAGGPVEPLGLIVLAELEDTGATAILVHGNVGVLVAGAETESLPAAVRGARVFAGHAGWGPGQLDAELEASGWIVEASACDDIFSAAPEELWGAVLTRKGGRYALLARVPADPSLN